MAKDDLNLNLSSAFEETYETIDGTPVFKMLIDGKWRSSERGELFEVHTPIDGSVIARAQTGTKNDTEFACRTAKENRGIRELPGSERIEIFECAAEMLEKHRNEFIRVLQIEAGKTALDAEGEFDSALQRFRFTKEEASRIFGEYIPGDWNKGTTEKMAMVIREPVGVVAAIIPFNYPLFIAATKIAPGLLAGNSVVLKPSSTNPIASTLLARVLQIAGVPDGSINLITGIGSEAGDALVESEHVDMINFTGSTPVGKSIAQKAGMKRLHLELGGKAYALVLEDADLDLASQKCVDGSLKFAGQRCDAVSAVLAMEPIADALVEKIVAEVDRWKLGDPRDESVNIGPVINSQAAQRINGQVLDAIAKGAELLRGGKFSGSYFQPTVLDHVPTEAVIATEEVFGPVVTIIRCKDEDEALKFARQSKYGLESCVFTRDFYRMWRVAKALECGEVTINDCPSHGVGYFPFGGIKQSGMGREGIGYSIDEMTRLKTIVFNLAPAGLGKKEHRAATCKTGFKQ
jgi:acyl-CoA reductase-like NAD-dependent aldehyde dehydrogenase